MKGRIIERKEETFVLSICSVDVILMIPEVVFLHSISLEGSFEFHSKD
jgi:hypothetical protein